MVEKVLIAFNNPNVGSIKRRENNYLKSQYPDKNVTPIERLNFISICLANPIIQILQQLFSFH